MEVYHTCDKCSIRLSWYDPECCTYKTVNKKYWVLLDDENDEWYTICQTCRAPKLIQLSKGVKGGTYFNHY